MPIPDIPEHHHDGLTDRERTMSSDNWIVEVTNWRELGEPIAAFNHFVGTDVFVGTAEMTVEGGLRKLEIILLYDENEKFRCDICNNIPSYRTIDNPGICTFCGQKVCDRCRKGHDRTHWRPQRTIGGDILCTQKNPCLRDQCPICNGAPF